MKNSLLLTGVAILLLGITQKFDGQEKTQNHRKQVPSGMADIEQQRGMAQAPFFSRQEPHRWMSGQTLPYQQRMTNLMGQQDLRVNTAPTGGAFTQHELSAGVDTAWVRHYSSHVFGGADHAAAMAIDDSGNVYVTGVSQSSDQYNDFATIKYNSAGVEQWVARYNESGNAVGWVTDLVVDISGNVYVTGCFGIDYFARDYTTVKYNAEGIEQWVARYNGPGNAGDEANALSVDASGNIYVTGGSQGDYATIKYNSDGVEQWVARYNGAGNAEDWATELAVDASGNVYVTGNSATIKYNSNGAQQWVAFQGGKAITVDGSGNVYVTGSSKGSGTGDDFATVKYNSDGVQQWVARYNGPGNYQDVATALAVDDTGNVYVTGWSPGSGTAEDYATIKYNSAGVEQWVTRYNGPENSSDCPYALAVDASGNVYVTGCSNDSGGLDVDYATIKYNSAGIEQWVVRYDGPNDNEGQTNYMVDYAIGLAVDRAGNVYVVGTVGDTFWGDGPIRSGDYATIKYNAAGTEEWTAIYNGPAIDYNYATALTVDKLNNVYVSGYSTCGSGKSDYVTIKYDANGTVQWIDRCPEGNQGTRLVVDGSGNAYVTGFGDNGGYITIKYNASGKKQWVSHFNKAVVGESRWPGFPWHISLAVDCSGNVYVAGGIEITNDNSDYVTIKYDSSGNEQWAVTYDGPAHFFDNADAVAVDNSGNVYVTGTSHGNGADIATIKYNNLGIEQWVARFDGPGTGPANNWDMASDMAVDKNGNVYVTGRTRSSVTGEDFVTIKYNASGVSQWIVRYSSGSGNTWDEATSLVLDHDCNVYVTGLSNGYGDYATIKYNNSGEQQWVARYSNSAWRSYDFPYDLVVDASNNVYVTGFSIGSEDNSDFITIKYNASGDEQWIAQYDGSGHTSDEACCVAVDDDGNVYVTGTNWDNDWSIMTTIKYTQTGTPVVLKNELASFPIDFNLTQNYPNPFNPNTTIEFALPKSAFVTLKVYNLLGEEVATLVAEQRAAGIHKLNWDASGLASGVYLYRLEAGDPSNKSGQAGQGFVQVKKLILIR